MTQLYLIKKFISNVVFQICIMNSESKFVIIDYINWNVNLYYRLYNLKCILSFKMYYEIYNLKYNLYFKLFFKFVL